YEGPAKQDGYNGSAVCQSLWSQTPSPVRAPLVWWEHKPDESSSSIGGVFYNGGVFPGAYEGAYFYGDYSQNWIRYIRVNDAITLNGTTYAKGLGVHAASTIRYDLGGACTAFTGSVGVDDEVGAAGSVVFQVLGDGTKIYDSGLMNGGTATKSFTISLTGVKL